MLATSWRICGQVDSGIIAPVCVNGLRQQRRGSRLHIVKLCSSLVFPRLLLMASCNVHGYMKQHSYSKSLPVVSIVSIVHVLKSCLPCSARSPHVYQLMYG